MKNKSAKNCLKLKKIEIFSVLLRIFSENWCVRSKKIWKRIIKEWLGRAGIRNARSRAVTRLTVYRAIEFWLAKKLNRWAKYNGLGLKLSEKLANIWYFHLRKYELMVMWERWITCWAQIIFGESKKCQKLKKSIFLVFSKGFLMKIGASGAKKYGK